MSGDVRITGGLVELGLDLLGCGVAQINIAEGGHHSALILTGLTPEQCATLDPLLCRQIAITITAAAA